MFNQVTLVGNAGSDPDVKSFGDGKKVAKVNMGVTRPTKNKETDWFTCEMWGKQAEIAEQYLKKGDRFLATGSLQNQEWEHNGEKKRKTVVHVREIRLMQPKKDGGNNASESEGNIFGGNESDNGGGFSWD